VIESERGECLSVFVIITITTLSSSPTQTPFRDLEHVVLF
jgi:hypothetical protein